MHTRQFRYPHLTEGLRFLSCEHSLNSDWTKQIECDKSEPRKSPCAVCSRATDLRRMTRWVYLIPHAH